MSTTNLSLLSRSELASLTSIKHEQWTSLRSYKAAQAIVAAADRMADAVRIQEAIVLSTPEGVAYLAAQAAADRAVVAAPDGITAEAELVVISFDPALDAAAADAKAALLATSERASLGVLRVARDTLYKQADEAMRPVYESPEYHSWETVRAWLSGAA